MTIKLLIVVVPPEIVEEALSTPLTKRFEEIVEEAEEIKPPTKVERLATDKVEEADNGPVTFKELEMVEEPLTIKPPRSVNLPASPKTPAFKVEKAKKPVP